MEIDAGYEFLVFHHFRPPRSGDRRSGFDPLAVFGMRSLIGTGVYGRCFGLDFGVSFGRVRLRLGVCLCCGFCSSVFENPFSFFSCCIWRSPAVGSLDQTGLIVPFFFLLLFIFFWGIGSFDSAAIFDINFSSSRDSDLGPSPFSSVFLLFLYQYTLLQRCGV
ncbi:uncharacterized protein BO80DRAFT_176078 [Aspergillus ibericus CBS 121593]|uniref:Uncharacterized protein n=1 Tax=Aspergillus ibericus CBS 121593 TaxID=1448316 RepID=A0A395HBK6_9EURO|nr:hypothetical protein BO80DRAFT_176078 [Aspergillus ibericus CBS 121593]RAL05080.1 hypothetical protein BO80DRAFT_176078 [Aspergillus ibericus CBS 121593]